MIYSCENFSRPGGFPIDPGPPAPSPAPSLVIPAAAAVLL